ncbi:hypothetical protein AWB69_06925 [Caballeronia udeis]|uniref:Uncharacterized protein n=1 Tax=Caballeronia udeis TaxID=1232866 RepID=A0A158J072_9BURK|nr:hypothetical protein [Caballeronia udeis]SAL62135.1 hypothetical protein AWB69_06925 [Caballeronia udeis]
MPKHLHCFAAPGFRSTYVMQRPLPEVWFDVFVPGNIASRKLIECAGNTKKLARK